MILRGRVALVTGGAVRIGQALALALADSGCDVFVHYRSSQDAAEGTVAQIRRRGQRSECGAADLGQPQSASELLELAESALGPVEILVSSAALFTEGDMRGTSIELWDRELAINLRAPFLLAQAFAARLGVDAEGAIVNVSDARVLRSGVDHFAYRLAKGALLDLTRNLALELAPRVRVNAVALGAVLPPPGEDDAYLSRLAERIPLRRVGSPQIVAENVLHLLRQDFLTGVVLPVDGGEFL